MRTVCRCRSSWRIISRPPRTISRASMGAPRPLDRSGTPAASTISSSGTRGRSGSSSGNSASVGGGAVRGRSSNSPPNSVPRSRSGDGPTTVSVGMMRRSARLSVLTDAGAACCHSATRGASGWRGRSASGTANHVACTSSTVRRATNTPPPSPVLTEKASESFGSAIT